MRNRGLSTNTAKRWALVSGHREYARDQAARPVMFVIIWEMCTDDVLHFDLFNWCQKASVVGLVYTVGREWAFSNEPSYSVGSAKVRQRFAK